MSDKPEDLLEDPEEGDATQEVKNAAELVLDPSEISERSIPPPPPAEARQSRPSSSKRIPGLPPLPSSRKSSSREEDDTRISGAPPVPPAAPSGSREEDETRISAPPAAAVYAPFAAEHINEATAPLPGAKVRARAVSMPPAAAAALSEPPSPGKAARELIQVCEEELSRSPDKLRRARLHYEIARLWEHPLGDVRKAATHFQQSYDRIPDHLPTIRGLRRTLTARRALKPAVALFDAEVRLTPNARRKARLLLAKGRMLEDGLGMRAEAREAYRAALDLCGNDFTVLRAIEQMELGQEGWRELERVYAQVANALEGDPRQRAALLIQRAQLLETRLDDVEAAIEQYERALELSAEAIDAREALKRLFRARGRYRDLISVLHREADATDSDLVRAAALYDAARLQSDKLEDRPAAVSALERALEATPGDPLMLEELARLREEGQDFEGLVVVLEQLVEALGERGDQLGTMHRIGQLHEERIEQPETAATWFRRALNLDPTYVPALQALGNLFVRAERWEDLVQMHLAEAEATEDARRRAAAHARVAEVYENWLDRPERAVEHHQRALSAVSVYAPSFKALTRLYAGMRRYRELVELYERAVEVSNTELAVAYLLKIGSLYEDHLQDPVQAIHAYRRIQARSPKHLGALHALQRATEAAGRYQELVEALEREAQLTEDNDHKVALLQRAGELLDEKLNDRDAASARLKHVLSLDPKYVPALTTLGRMYYRAGRWEDLLTMYAAELEVTPDKPAAIALLLKMGELCEQRLGRHDEAIAHYRKAVDLDARYGPAIQALARKLREKQDWDGLLEVLRREAQSLDDPQARALAFFRVGEVLEQRLDRVDPALDAYERALRERPHYLPAVQARARLRAQRGDWARLVDELAVEVDKGAETLEVTPLLMRMGEVWRDQLRDLRRAVAAFEQVLTVVPDHHGALLALEGLYRRTSNWDGLSRVLATQARVFGHPEARVAALRELGRAQQRTEATVEARRATYEAILSLAPGDTEALSVLEMSALEGPDDALLARVDEQTADKADDRALRSAHLTRLAEALEASGDENALATYQRALAEEPENLAATRGLSRLAGRSNDPAILGQAAQREAEVLGDRPLAARLWVKSAMVRLRAEGVSNAVVKELEHALEVDPDNPEAAKRLSDVLLGMAQPERLAEQLARAAGSATNSDRVSDLWRDTARLHADELENLAGAISALHRSLRAQPGNPDTMGELAKLFSRDGQWTEAANLLSRVIELSEDKAVIHASHLELAAIHDERLGDAEAAMRHLKAALALQPEDRIALRRFSELESREGDADAAAKAAQRLVDSSETDSERVDGLLHLARVQQRRKDREGAADALSEAVAIDGPHGGAGAAYREVLGELTTWHGYAEALREHLRANSSGLGAPPDVYLELARVESEELRQTEAALTTLHEGLERHARSFDLRSRYASQLRQAGSTEAAVTELRTLLDQDPDRAQTWRDLRETLAEMGRSSAAQLALAPLCVLGLATEAEKRLHAEVVPRPGRARPNSFVGPLFDEVEADLKPRGPAGELLEVLSEGLGKLYPPDLEGYGLSSRDRMGTRSDDSLRRLADRIASIVGADQFDLYLHRVRTRGVGVELTNPPALLVPASVADLNDAQQVFLIARPLVHFARKTHALLKLQPREVEVLLAAYGRTVAPGFGEGLTSEDFMAEQGKKAHKALPRRSRRTAEEKARAYVMAPEPDFAAWAASRERAATRVAALLADDLVSCAELVPNAEDSLDDPVRDLIRFWLSEPALTARIRAGLLVE